MNIGIFGGSFDPLHEEHRALCLKAIDALKLDKLIVVPANVPPHKKNAVLAPNEDRLNMLRLAFQGIDKVEISTYEFDKDGASYTYQTIEHFKSLYGGAHLYFLMGTDMLEDFPTWRYPERILSAASLFVTHRSGENVEKAKSLFLKRFPTSGEKVIFSAYTGKNISSTKIRNCAALKLSLNGMVCESVEDYIIKNNLYSLGELSEFVVKSLPISRLTHTMGVMNLAQRYAKRLKTDVQKARIAAMLHDVAKYFSVEDYPDFKIDDDVPNAVVHQFLGEYVARKVLKITDEEILSAIKYHTTGRASMTELEKIVFLADLLEEGRTYGEVEELRNAVEEDFERGFKLVIKRYYRLLEKERESVYHLTKQCYDFYVGE